MTDAEIGVEDKEEGEILDDEPKVSYCSLF